MTLATLDLQAITVARVVDVRGSAYPGPLLEAKKGIGLVSIGSVLEVWSSDRVTTTDMAVWAAKVGHIPLGFLPAEGYDRVFICRGK